MASLTRSLSMKTNQIHRHYQSEELKHGTKSDKSDLLTCLLPPQNTNTTVQPPVQCVIVDGAATVQMTKPGNNMTYAAYANKFFDRHVAPYLQNAIRTDVVFDVYKDKSLKAGTRAKRGDGQRQHVVPTGKVPRIWQQFLKASQDKIALFAFIAEMLVNRDMSTG